MRKNGILLPVSALPGKYGIGCFSKAAYTFVDSLKKAGQSYWQILPLGPTSYGDSPYQSFSTFAGNPYFIDLEALIQEGLLTVEECEAADFSDSDEEINYGKLYTARFVILKKAFLRAKAQGLFTSDAYQTFLAEEDYWLSDYALYMAVKNSYDGKSWTLWDEDIRLRTDKALKKYRKEMAEEISFYSYLQFLFLKQWTALKAYANKRGIEIIGDIPIYVALDSADTWANPLLFQLDQDNVPLAVAGCPPDAFSKTGQLWGNPLYDWEYHLSTGYDWWIRRIAYCFRIYDMVRIDHFRGFDEYYAIPYGDKTAEKGKWMPGPGMKFFDAVKDALGDLPIIAEDLGFLTPTVRQLLADSGYPGMKVLQFAFDSREESDYLPHNYSSNCVVYTGTHDNDTLMGWFEKMDADDRNVAMDYMGLYNLSREEVAWAFIRLAMSSVADTCILPIQDFLFLGSEARINTPSTLGGNWVWRMKPEAFHAGLATYLKRLAQITGRVPATVETIVSEIDSEKAESPATDELA